MAKSSNRKGFIRSVCVFGASVLFLFLFGVITSLRAELSSLEREEEHLKTSISEAESEEIRLKATITSLLSYEKVTDYAENVLGMQKLDRCQIIYLGKDEEDEVVLCNGKVPKDED